MQIWGWTAWPEAHSVWQAQSSWASSFISLCLRFPSLPKGCCEASSTRHRVNRVHKTELLSSSLLNYLIFLNEGQLNWPQGGEIRFPKFNNKNKGRNKKEIRLHKGILRAAVHKSNKRREGHTKGKNRFTIWRRVNTFTYVLKENKGGKTTHSTAKCTKDMKRKFTKEPEKAKNMKGSSKILNNKVRF